MKVLIGTDGSAESQDAIDRYCRLKPLAASEHVVVTVDEFQAYGIIDSVDDAVLDRVQRENSERILGEAKEILNKYGIQASYVMREGQSADEILKLADEEHADLIVIGARGAGAIERVLIGSTSDFVVSHSKSSVWVVRPTSSDAPPAEHISVCYDGSEASKNAIQFVQSLGLPTSVKISLVFFVRRPENLPDEIVYDEAQLEKFKKEMEEIQSLLATGGREVDCVIGETRHVGHGLVEFATRERSSLIVVGDKGRSAIARFFLGSISRFVLHHAHCGVLVVKQ